MPNVSNPRVAAGLWLTAATLSLIAAVITYSSEGRIKWFLLAASVFMAILGFRTLRSSRSTDA